MVAPGTIETIRLIKPLGETKVWSSLVKHYTWLAIFMSTASSIKHQALLLSCGYVFWTWLSMLQALCIRLINARKCRRMVDWLIDCFWFAVNIQIEWCMVHIRQTEHKNTLMAYRKPLFPMWSTLSYFQFFQGNMPFLPPPPDGAPPQAAH